MTALPARTWSARSPIRRAAALHRQGDRWRLVVVERPAGAGGVGVKLVEATTVPFGDVTAAKETFDRLKVERLVRVVPASSCVTRVIETPEGAEGDMAAALPLLAEAHLPAAIPAHRRAFGVIPGPASEGMRSAVVLGWTGAGETPEPTVMPEMELWTSEVVALLGLVEPHQSSVAVYADRDAESVAVLAWNGTRSTLRSVRESGGAEADWAGAVGDLLHDATRTAGIETSVDFRLAATGVPRTLWMDEDSRSRAVRVIAGAPHGDSAWLRDYAIAAGAAAGLISAPPAGLGLFAMTPDPQIERRGRIEQGVAWLAQPRNARNVLVCALLAIALVPMITAWTTRAIYRAKSEAIAKQQQGMSPDELERRLSVYAELAKRRWPMTKLVADIAQVMPQGVTVENLQFVAGLNQPFTIRGKADGRDIVSDFKDALNDTGVFSEVEIGRSQPKGDIVEFDMSGKVNKPQGQAKGTSDFIKKPMAVRMYGESARTASPSGGGTSAGSGSSSDGERRGGRGRGDRGERDSGSSGSGGGSGSRSSAASKSNEPIPAAITTEQIKATDAAAARKEFALRMKASSRPDISSADKSRLKSEVEALRTHLQELKTASAAPPAPPAGDKPAAPAAKPADAVDKKATPPPPADSPAKEDDQ